MGDQRILDLDGPPPATFAHFYPGVNLPVVEALRAALAERRAQIYLTGEAGSGRSHLLRAAAAARRAAGGTALYAELGAVDPQWIEHCESMSLVALDDIDAWAGDAAGEEALFHALNRIQASGATVLASAHRRPPDCGFTLPDLISRLTSFSHHRLRRLADDDLLAALRLQAAARSIPIDDKVLRWLLDHHQRHLPTQLAALVRLQTTAYAEKRRITTALAREVFAEPTTRSTIQ